MITGASSGIGAQAARHLAHSHPEDRLILIGRNPDRTKRVAAEVGADLIVKGGYTQSRLRQMIFGGATSHILAQADVPVFMAH